MDEQALEELKEALQEEPRSISEAIKWAEKELDLRHYQSRASIERWIKNGVIDERRENKPGPGRPKRIVGGVPDEQS